MATLVSVVLCKGTEYTLDDVIYKINQPAMVDAAIAERLLETRRFRYTSDHLTDIDPDTLALSDFMKPGVPEHMPKNSLGCDDLNGKRVVFRRAGAIGDCIFVAQIGALLKEQYPTMRLTLSVQPRWMPLMQMFAHVDNVIPIQDTTVYTSLVTYDYLIDFSDVIEAPNALKKDYYVSHLERCGIDPAMLTDKGLPKCALRNGDTQSNARTLLRKQLMQKHGLLPGEYLVVLRGTSNSLKTWDSFIYQSVIDRLLAVSGVDRQYTHIVAVGTKTDTARYNKQAFSYIELDDLAIDIAAELVLNACCVVGGDTGLTHLAVAFGIPCVSYWQATDPQLTLKHAPDKDVTKYVVANQPCHPCNVLRPSFCKFYDGQHPTCAHKVPVNALVEAVQGLTRAANHASGSGLRSNACLLNTIEARRLYDNALAPIAFVMDDCDRYTGGGFYMWSLVQLFAKRPETLVYVLSKTNRFVYTDTEHVPDNVVLVHDAARELLFGTGKLPFKLVIGHPHVSGIAAVQYAQTNPGVKSALTIYETPDYIAKYRDGRDCGEEFWAEYKAAMYAADVVFTISKEVRVHLVKWLEKDVPSTQLGKPAPKIHLLTPMINEDVADTVLPKLVLERVSREHRENSIVLIARNVKYKRLDNTLEIFATKVAPHVFSRSNPCTVHVIGDSVGSTSVDKIRLWAEFGVVVEFHQNLSEAGKWELLRTAKLFLHPSDFEGFGIPIAEAMYAGVPVLCKPLPVFQEVYAQHPYYYTDDESFAETARLILEAWDTPEDDAGRAFQKLHDFSLAAINHVMRRYTRGIRATKNMPAIITAYFKKMYTEAHEGLAVRRKAGEAIRLAMVTTFNTRCGVAETTRELLASMRCTYKVFAPVDNMDDDTVMIREDGPNVLRCWRRDFTSDGALMNEITAFGATVVHFQHEFSLFKNTQELLNCFRKLRNRGVKVVVTLHTIPIERTTFIAALEEATDLIITTKPSKIVSSAVVPLPVEHVRKVVTTAEARAAIPELDPNAYVVGTFGMFQPHKGIRQFLKTYQDVANNTAGKVQFLVSGFSPMNRSSLYYRETIHSIQHWMDAGAIVVFNDYPELETIQQRIAACDVMVFQHAPTPHESASASIRSAIALGKAVICTDVPMFNEFTDKQVKKVPYVADSGPVSAELTQCICQFASERKRSSYERASVRFAIDNSTKKITGRMVDLYAALVAGNPIQKGLEG